MANANAAASGGALASLKNKMQSLRDEMDKTREQYESKCQELESEKSLRCQVNHLLNCDGFFSNQTLVIIDLCP